MIASAIQTQLIARNCDRVRLFVRVISRAFVNKSTSSAEMLVWLLFYLLLCLRETKQMTSFGEGNA